MRNFIVTFSIEAKSKIGFGQIDITSTSYPRRELIKERIALENHDAHNNIAIINIMELSEEDFEQFTR